MTKEQGEKLFAELESRGYKRYRKHYKNESFSYFKTFDSSFANEDSRRGFQVAFLVYDYTEYPIAPYSRHYGIQHEFLLLNEGVASRFDFAVTDYKKSVEEFEEFCLKAYQFILANL
jgi:hypothetical protein